MAIVVCPGDGRKPANPMYPRKSAARPSPAFPLAVKFALNLLSRHRRPGQSAGDREQRRLLPVGLPRQQREIIHHLPKRRLGQTVEFLDNRVFQCAHAFNRTTHISRLSTINCQFLMWFATSTLFRRHQAKSSKKPLPTSKEI